MEKTELYPLLFRPNLHPVVWGGHSLKPWKGLPADTEPIGESWEVSVVPSAVSIVANGPLEGTPLTRLVADRPLEMLGERVAGRYGNELPLLVKFIDAEKDLSIQVHPDDTMARREHGKRGKSEMWYVISAQPGACLYAGFKEHITPYEYRRRVEDGSITEVLARHEVRAGDVFYLPAGRVHAICGGILLAEVQQSSDVTYRIFDYNRPGMDGRPRELHTELAAQALDYTVESEYRTLYTPRENGASLVVDTPHFTVRINEVDRPIHRDLIKYDSFIISMCMQGSCRIRLRGNGTEVPLQAGQTCFIPAAVADYDILPDESRGLCRILDAFIDNKDRSLLSSVSRFLHLTRK